MKYCRSVKFVRDVQFYLDLWLIDLRFAIDTYKLAREFTLKRFWKEVKGKSYVA